MKSVLLDKNGKVWDVTATGGEFEVYDGEPDLLTWETTEDMDVVIGEFKQEDGSFVNLGVQESLEPSGAYTRFLKNRQAAYGDIGEQLDMLYKDALNGTTTWVDSVTAAKELVVKQTMPEDFEQPEGDVVLTPPTR